MIHNKNYIIFKSEIDNFINNFTSQGEFVVFAERNSIKKFNLSNGKIINIKSFKRPHFINKVAYKYVRKSKAKRSYENANILLEKGINTPIPITFVEKFDFFGLNESFYVCEQLKYDLTFRDLIDFPQYPDLENIVKQFIQFSFNLHEKDVNFLDHTSGNTLIIKDNNTNIYSFYLVDLNRIKFNTLSYKERLHNLKKLTHNKKLAKIISTEYANLIKHNPENVKQDFMNILDKFWIKYNKRSKYKQNIKRIFKFKLYNS